MGIGASGLPGRDRAHRRMAAMEARARRGRSSAVLYVGAAGVGKTALLQSLHRISSARSLLIPGGDRRLARTPGGVATMLALPVRHRLVPLAAQRRLDALWEDPACAPDVAAETLLRCAVTGRRSPLVYLVDDVDLLRPEERATVHALVRLANREPVVVVGTSSAPIEGWPAASVPLRPLADAVVRDLLVDEGVHPRVIDELLPAIGGNPAALHALLASLSAAVRAGTDRLPSPLPVDPRLLAERSIELAALCDDRRLAELAHELDAPATATTLAATNPHLLRRLHRFAAERSDGAERLLHRAAAAGDVDDALARELADAAEERLRERDLAAAIELLTAAGRVAADPSLLGTCWYRAALGSYLTGHSQRALDLVAALRSVPGVDVSGFGLDRIEALASLHVDGIETAVGRLDPAAERAIAAGDDVTARSLLLIAGVFSLYGCRVDDLAGFAARCAALPAAEPLAAATAAVFSSSADLYAAGDAAAVRRLAPLLSGLAAIPAPPDPLPDLDLDPSRSQFFAALLLLTDEHWQPAQRLLERVWVHDREAGWTGVQGLDAAWYAQLLWRTGAWSKALDVAHTTLAAMDPDLGRSRLWLHAFLAGAELVAGDVDAAARHRAAVVADGGSPSQIALVELIMRSGTAVGHLGAGEPEAALEDLTIAADLAGRTHPGLVWWHTDLVEALAASGQHAAALEAASELRALAGNAPAPALRGLVLRARGLAANGRRRLRLLTDAVTVHGSADCPFELARSLLALAEARRAMGEGEDLVASAAARSEAIFDRLGAAAFTARAGAVLAGSSGTEPLAGLTRREHEIAALVAAGATNKQVAAALGVSASTVGFHLESIFRKLHLSSRSQLASIVHGGGSTSPCP